MNKFLKSAMSLIGITPIVIATVLPAANIGREQQLDSATAFQSYEYKILAAETYTGGQTLVTAPARSSDTKAFDFSGLKITLKEIPLPEPELKPEPLLEQNTVAESSQSTVTPPVVTDSPSTVASTGLYTLGDLMFQGVIFWEGLKFTYYSQSVLPGGGLNIPGRHINAGGYVSDGDGFIVLAGSAPLGTVYSTPFGSPGKIYDRGTVGNHLDVYTM